MAKVDFNVVAILPGRREDYFDFWNKNIKINKSGEKLDSSMLAVTVHVEARNKIDAENQVRLKYPDHLIDSAATERLG
jgi:hypothetical protein